MILSHDRIDLFGKMLFETIVLVPPYHKPNPMPNEACFLYVMEGAYNSISEQGELRIQAEESLLMRCGNYLSEMLSTEQSQKYQAVAVHFYPEVLQKIYENELPEFLKSAGPSDVTMSTIKGDVLIKKYIDSILFYFENPQLADEEILILKLKEIILLLNKTRNAPQIRRILSNLFNPLTYTFREVVEAHLYHTITIERLALLVGMSLSTFKREFEKVYQASPATYIRNKKLAKADEYLRSTDMRATEIAYECGFANVSHFSRTFKQKHHLSPTEFRLNQKSKSLN